MSKLNDSKFQPGQMVMTRGVNDRMADDEEFTKFVLQSIRRHLKGDWGDLTPEDKALNEAALNPDPEATGRLFSAYEYNGKADRIYIITEWDRSYTTVLFPREY